MRYYFFLVDLVTPELSWGNSYLTIFHLLSLFRFLCAIKRICIVIVQFKEKVRKFWVFVLNTAANVVLIRKNSVYIFRLMFSTGRFSAHMMTMNICRTWDLFVLVNVLYHLFALWLFYSNLKALKPIRPSFLLLLVYIFIHTNIYI